MKFSRSFLLASLHKDWYICQHQKSASDIHNGTPLQLDFYNGDPDVLERCTFSFQPRSQSDDKYMNCKNVIGPVTHPSISRQPLPHPPHLVPETPSPAPAQPTCIPVCPAGSVGGMPGGQTKVPGYPGEPSIASSKSTSNFYKLIFLFFERKCRQLIRYTLKQFETLFQGCALR